jgi:hypothetical protein
VAQTPLAGVGVNVYVVVTADVVAVLFTAGDHVPVKPFVDNVGNVIVAPLQYGPN